jgi:flagellar FliL protein
MAPTQTPVAATPLPGSTPNGESKGTGKGAGKVKGKGKLLIIVALAVVVLGGGGAAAYWMWAGSRAPADGEATAEGATDPDGKAKAEKKKSAKDQGLVEFPGFLVNLADAGGQAYLRVTLSLLVEDAEQATVLAEMPALKSVLRSSILEVLATQTGAVLVTPEGKDALKRAIIEKINALEQDVKVDDVLFSDFVVQY